MTALRQAAIAELEKVPEDKLGVIIQFISSLMGESEDEKRVWNLEQFVMPSTERSQNADTYIRGLRDDDRL